MKSIQMLSHRVVRVLGCNPGPLTLQGTNTYLVGTGEARLLIDTGDGRVEYLEELNRAMKERDIERISAVLVTHHHLDHVGGVGKIEEAAGGEVYMKHSSKVLPGALDIHDNQLFCVDGATVRAILTPGHASDHVCFYLEEEKALFSGDCVLGDGSTAVFDSLHDYVRSLKKILDEDFSRIYPGHGNIIEEGHETIRQYLKHRQDREDQILELLKELGDLNSSQLVAIIYKDYPKEVHGHAERVIQQHLEKLKLDGKFS